MDLLCPNCEHAFGKFYCGRCFHVKYCSRQCQQSMWRRHKKWCYPLDKALFNNKKNKMLHLAMDDNLFSEYEYLRNIHNEHGDNMNIFDQGRFYIFQGIIDMIMFDPVMADMKPVMTDDETKQWQGFENDIRKGGVLVHQESPESMHDPLIWLFIPKYLHRDIHFIWNGIGDWQI